MSAEAIADIYEEDATLVARIYKLVEAHPNWDDEKVYQNL